MTDTQRVLLTDLQLLTVQAAIDLFVQSAEVSESTRRWYARRLARLAAGLGQNRALADVQEVDLLRWFAGVQGSPYTRHGYGRAARRLFRWLALFGLTSTNLADHLKLPRLPKSGRAGISERDAGGILAAAQGHPRDFAILNFIQATGCRLGGAAGLLLDDLDLERRRAKVREKGEKERTVFLTVEALAALRAWLAVRPVCASEQVFVGRSNAEQDWHGLRERSIYERFRLYAEQAGVKRNWSPHQWRHRFGRRLAENGANLGSLSQMMGHRDVKVTVDFYAQFGEDALQEQFDRFGGSAS